MSTENNEQFRAFAKQSEKQVIRSNNAVIYTRVSTKEQAEGNASLETQKKYCLEFARKKELNVIAFFGGTYESAKSDERKEFKKMLDFVRQKKDISYIIVYSYDRFSRTGANGAYISNNLLKQGIMTLSVTQEVDPGTPSGSFQQNLYYMFSQFDNELRREKTVTGMKEKVRQGYWMWHVPFGYTNLSPGRPVDRQKLVVNEEGKLLQKAFLWKAKENIPDTEISERLKRLGLSINAKRLSDFFRNPFYCAKITSKMFPGEIIEGKHEKLVSEELFLKVNNLLTRKHEGYNSAGNNEQLPLKIFVKCDTCGTGYTGYIVKKKGIYYYKCPTKGCCKNKNAGDLNEMFLDYLSRFMIEPVLSDVLKEIMKNTFFEMNKDMIEKQQLIKEQLSDITSKIEVLEEKYVTGEIERELYVKYREKFLIEKRKLNEEFENSGIQTSNLEECIEFVVRMSYELAHLWEVGNFETKKKIQKTIFPEGILFDAENNELRTTRINSFFYVIPTISEIINAHKKRGSASESTSSALVAGTGFEPMTFGL